VGSVSENRQLTLKLSDIQCISPERP